MKGRQARKDRQVGRQGPTDKEAVKGRQTCKDMQGGRQGYAGRQARASSKARIGRK
jgi:hypothetical protein